MDPQRFVGGLRRRQIDHERPAENRIGFAAVKRPAHPHRRELFGRAEKITGQLIDVGDIQAATIQHELRRGGVETVHGQRRAAAQLMRIEVHVQIQIDMRHLKLIDIREGEIGAAVDGKRMCAE